MPKETIDPRVELGRRLADQRLRMTLTVEGLAAACDLDASNLRKVESGAGNPTLKTVLRLAGVLEMDLGELFTGLDPYGLPDGDRPTRFSDFDDTFWRKRDRTT